MPKAEIRGHELVLHGEIRTGDVADFRALAHRFVDSEHAELVMDISRVRIVSSTTIGMVWATHLRAMERGKRFTVRLGEKALWLFELMRLTECLHIETVPGEAAPPE